MENRDIIKLIFSSYRLSNSKRLHELLKNKALLELSLLQGGIPTITHVFKGQGNVVSIIHLPDGSTATADHDGIINVWDTKNDYELIMTIDTKLHILYSIASLPNGDIIVSSTSICFYSKANNYKYSHCIGCEPSSSISVRCLLSRDGRLFANVSTLPGPGSINVFDSNDNFKLVKALKMKTFHSGLDDLCYSAIVILLSNCNLAITISNIIYILDTVDYEPKLSLHGHKQLIVSVAELPEGDIISGSYDKTIRLWSKTYYECSKVIDVQDIVYSFEVFGHCYMVSSSDNTLKIWDINSDFVCVKTYSNDSDIKGLFTLPGGKVASLSYSSIKIWEIK
jgi:WD40 repeat protein